MRLLHDCVLIILLTPVSQTNTKDLHISVNLTGAAKIASEIGTPVVIEAKIRNVYWFVIADDIMDSKNQCKEI